MLLGNMARGRGGRRRVYILNSEKEGCESELQEGKAVFACFADIGWPWTSKAPVSTSQVLWLLACTTTPSFILLIFTQCWGWTWSFMYARLPQYPWATSPAQVGLLTSVSVKTCNENEPQIMSGCPVPVFSPMLTKGLVCCMWHSLWALRCRLELEKDY